MEEIKGIAQTKELLKGIEVLVEFGAKVAADKKVNAEDLPAVIELAKKFEVLMAAAKDADQIKEELKDLDETEIVEIIANIYAIAKKYWCGLSHSHLGAIWPGDLQMYAEIMLVLKAIQSLPEILKELREVGQKIEEKLDSIAIQKMEKMVEEKVNAKVNELTAKLKTAKTNDDIARIIRDLNGLR